MSRKVINITHSATKYDILSQTPKNYNKDNLEFYDYNKPRENINCYDFYMNALNSIKLND